MKKYYLMAPGPTPVPSNVLLAMAQPMIHHRTPEYEALFIEVRAGLKRLFQTSQDVVPFTSSGTGAMEAAVVNTLSAGDTVLVLRAGKFVEATLASTTAAVAASAATLAKDVRNPIVDSAGPDAWPISGLTFLLVYRDQKDAAKGRALAEFIRWAMTDGQPMVESLDYARLPESVVKLNLATLRSLTSGGKPLLAGR